MPHHVVTARPFPAPLWSGEHFREEPRRNRRQQGWSCYLLVVVYYWLLGLPALVAVAAACYFIPGTGNGNSIPVYLCQFSSLYYQEVFWLCSRCSCFVCMSTSSVLRLLCYVSCTTSSVLRLLYGVCTCDVTDVRFT